MTLTQWRGWEPGRWQNEVNVRDFIFHNQTPYDGDDRFLSAPTARTQALWKKVTDLMAAERAKGGLLDVDTEVVSSIVSHPAGYIDRELETIVGLQTDKPLKRALIAYGGIRLVKTALESYGEKLDLKTEEIFEHRKTHNDGVFGAYTPEMLAARKSGIITGLPDAYGRGRIIGDYRRIALYGADRLIDKKKRDLANLDTAVLEDDVILQREELSEQIDALNELKKMAATYGFDISMPAMNGLEAVQWLYFGYLASVKEQNGAAMSLGRTSSFLDIYFERDLKEGTFTESQIQEFIDHFVMKLRMVRFLRTPDYNELFSGDPTWVTEALGGVGEDGRPRVSKTSFRYLQTLYNLGPAPEPNLTVLWSERLPRGFKEFCARVSRDTSSIQYENDDLMRHSYGDDYSIACCVSAMKTGRQMQFFGARANLAKCLLYAINGGKDEVSGVQVGPEFAPVATGPDGKLDYEETLAKFDHMMDWLSALYVKTLNIIHFMHDRYCYERIEMALHDTVVDRFLACGMAGLSIVADSLSAIRYAEVRPVRDKNGLVVDYEVKGDYPKYGNNDDRVDQIAVDVVKRFSGKLKRQRTYRNSIPTLSVLTITSNVVYGKKTGNTPDGRRKGEPFAPGANPMHGRDTHGAVASMASVAKIPYSHAKDGISYTFSIVPRALGKTPEDQTKNLVGLLDGYFHDGGHHINVNVLDRETLLRAMDHPEEYPQLTIRVSGYAVNFIKLTREQQLDVIRRTFHERAVI